MPTLLGLPGLNYIQIFFRNGDLNKPTDGLSGRIRAIEKWQELTNSLNLDTTGTSKPVEKWKKVWSDLKNNTKRKASKIHRAVGGTGGGPASKMILIDQEQRVLNIIGPQAATGLVTVQEVGLEYLIEIWGTSARTNLKALQIKRNNIIKLLFHYNYLTPTEKV
ncbi:unnamed protein product, partial [Brenthis ino]